MMKVSAVLKKQKKVKSYDHMLHCLAQLCIRRVSYSLVVLPKVLALLSICRLGGHTLSCVAVEAAIHKR
jgi:hypothetical protein